MVSVKKKTPNRVEEKGLENLIFRKHYTRYRTLDILINSVLCYVKAIS